MRFILNQGKQALGSLSDDAHELLALGVRLPVWIARASSPNDSAREALDHLARIFEALKVWDLEDHFLVDLGEVRGFAYYTGIHFEGFLPQLGTAVLSGGRYDDLMSQFIALRSKNWSTLAS